MWEVKKKKGNVNSFDYERMERREGKEGIHVKKIRGKLVIAQ